MTATTVKIAVTGATGFVGSALVGKLATLRQFDVQAWVRRIPMTAVSGAQYVQHGHLSPDANWQKDLVGLDALVHTAARVHVMRDTVADPLTEFRQVNVQGTLNLARQAAAAGVRRFVFLSSIKVNGEITAPGLPFSADDVPAPFDAYGVSKMEAEQGLREIAAETGMAVVIIRPPLVYGPGVKANFQSMMRWLKRGIPLPLGSATENRRSLVALDNLLDLIVRCIDHPAAANQTFLVSDGEDLSTANLLRRLGAALGRPARLLSVPIPVLTVGAALIGKRGVVDRLCGSLQVDIQKNKRLLNWEPPVAVDVGLRIAAEGFLREAAV